MHQNLDYHGEKKNWKFEKYQAAHLEQKNIPVGMEVHGYSSIDDRDKVRYSIDGIKNYKLEVGKTHVLVSPASRQDFTGVCSLFSDYIKQCKGMNHPVCNTCKVSAGSGRGGRVGSGQGRGGRGITRRKGWRQVTTPKFQGDSLLYSYV